MSWDDLSMREKAAMMRVAVRNRMFDIDLIKEAYNNLDRLVSNSEVINPNQYTPSVNLNINPALDYVGNALESISGYEYEGNPLNKLGIDMSFDLGTTGSSMYPNGVRFVKKFEDGGDINFLNRILLGLSSFLMELGRSGNPKFKTEGTLGAAQDTYLLPRDVLDKFFKEAGYIEGTPGDYGLVSKAVGDRDIPVYLRAPDAVSRDDLAVIGNPKEGDYEIRNGLYHAGTHPTALYVGDDYKMYLKQWDLNDYGTSAGGAGASSHYNRGRKILSNLVDFIGSPVVVTSGFLPIISGISSDHHVTLMDLWEKNDPYALKYVKEQGLYPHYEEVLAEYLGVPTDLYVKLLVGFDSVPTIVVTPKGKYIYNSITGEEMPIDDYLDANGVSEKKYNGGKINRFNDGGPEKRYISYYELANNPDKYGYHLDADKKNGKEVYYNAANQLWFYADKAKDKNNLSEITENYLDVPENKLAEFKRENEFSLNQPATMSYISSLIDGMKTPAEIQAILNAHKEQAKEMIEWFPFVGDAIEGYDMAKDVYTDIKDEDYLGASGKTAAGLALVFAPKWLLELYEGSKDAYKAYRKTQKAKNLIKQGTGNKGLKFKEAMANAEEYVDLYKKHIDRDGPVDGNYLLEELREAEKIALKYPKYNAIRSKNNDYSIFLNRKLNVNLHDLQEQESLINNAVESVGPRLKNIYDNLDNIDNTGLLKRIYDDAESPELLKYLRDISISNNVDNIPLDDIVKTALLKNYTTWRRMTPKKFTLTADDFLTFKSNSSPGLLKSHAFVDPQKYKFINTGGLEVAGSQYGLHAARYTPKLDQFDLSGTPADWWANRNSFWNSFNKEGITVTTGMHFGSHKNVPAKNFNTMGLLDINVPKYMLPALSGHKVFIGETGTSMKNFFDVDLFMDYKDGYLYNTKERVRDLDPLNLFFIDPDTELDFKYGGKINRF